MKTDEKRLIRQGEIPIGYWEGETVFLDSEFLGCGIGRELIRRGRSVRWVPGIARELDRETPTGENPKGAGVPTEGRN